jgi:hypothetical protein
LLLFNASAPIPGMDGRLRFRHANFGVEDIDEIMLGANYMTRRGWEPSHLGLGRHRIDSALFYYLPCPAGGEAEYGADADYVDNAWVPRDWIDPLFGFAHFVHNLPDFLAKTPDWQVSYLTSESAWSVANVAGELRGQQYHQLESPDTSQSGGDIRPSDKGAVVSHGRLTP